MAQEEKTVSAPRTTPWGIADSTTRLAPGIWWVSTPSHGGLIVNQEAASRLSEEARKEGFRWQGDSYLAYEEDCDYAIALFELPELWAEFFKDSEEPVRKDVKGFLWRHLSMWHADYLQARGIEPEAQAYAFWREMTETWDRQAKRDPDLIMSASKVNGDPLLLDVTTADGAHHLVTLLSYEKKARAKRVMGYRLSDCEVVK
jgi:hypothetical protein